MKGYVIKTEETKAIKKAAKKFGTLAINTKDMDGVIEIQNYRKYRFFEEVDILFKGKIYVSMNSNKIWVGFDDIQKQIGNISKVKLHRLLKRMSFESVKTRANFFGVDLQEFRSIKTVKWVS